MDLYTLWKRDEEICHICDRKVKWAHATRDHVIPKSKGGPGTDDNIRLAHWRCNQKKGDS